MFKEGKDQRKENAQLVKNDQETTIQGSQNERKEMPLPFSREIINT